MNIVNFFHKIIDSKDNLKYRWQRGIKGYSTLDRWSIHSWFEDIMPKMLLEFRNDLHGCPVVFTRDKDGKETQKVEKGEEDWKAILDRMIFCFTEMNEEKCSVKNEYEAEYFRQLYGGKDMMVWLKEDDFNFYDAEEDIEKAYRKRKDEIEKYRNEMKNEGLDLFKEYFWYLWD